MSVTSRILGMCLAAGVMAGCTPGAVVIGGQGGATTAGGGATTAGGGGTVAGGGGTTAGGGARPTTPVSTGPTGGVINANAPALYGNVVLSAGFQPDPFSMSLDAGGQDDAGRLIGGACTGFINGAAPDVELSYSAGSFPLTIAVDSFADTTLVINLPDGSWFCVDDSTNQNPVAFFAVPQSGVYDIWVGTFQPGQPQPAQLFITEQ